MHFDSLSLPWNCTKLLKQSRLYQLSRPSFYVPFLMFPTWANTKSWRAVWEREAVLGVGGSRIIGLQQALHFTAWCVEGVCGATASDVQGQQLQWHLPDPHMLHPILLAASCSPNSWHKAGGWLRCCRRGAFHIDYSGCLHASACSEPSCLHIQYNKKKKFQVRQNASGLKVSLHLCQDTN